MNTAHWVVGLTLTSPLSAAVVQSDPEPSGANSTHLAAIPERLSLEGKPLRSPDGRTVAPNRNHVVWSRDGRSVGYVGLAAQAPHAVIGESVFGPYHWAEGPVFSDDGEHWAFRVGKSVGDKRENWWVLRDGKEESVQDWLGAIALAPSGAAAVWTQPGARLAAGGEYTRTPMVLLTPWRKGARWDDALALTPVRFARDGSFLTTLASKGGEWRVLLVDKKGERELGRPQTWITEWDVSDDAKHVALCVGDNSGGGPDETGPPPGPFGGKSVVLFDKSTLGREYDTAEAPTLAPGGKRLAYRMRSKGREGVAFDNDKQARATHDRVLQIRWHPAGKQVAFSACDGCSAQEAMVDAAGRALFEGGKWGVALRSPGEPATATGKLWDEVAHVTWSNGGERLAYAARDAKGWRIVCGELASDAFDEVGPPVFASDAKALGFGARTGRELHWKRLTLE